MLTHCTYTLIVSVESHNITFFAIQVLIAHIRPFQLKRARGARKFEHGTFRWVRVDIPNPTV